MALVLGVDCSTQSTKVEIRRSDTGSLIGWGRAPHPPTSAPVSEQDPEAWWAALVSATGAALDRAGAGAGTQAGGGARAGTSGPPPIVAVSVAGQQHGMVALGPDGGVLRPAKLWNDTEAAPDAAWLVEHGGRQAYGPGLRERPTAAFTVAKLTWLHRREPDAFASLAHVLLPHDWLTYRLTGRMVTDRGDASGTGYWSPSEARWRTDLLGLIDPTKRWESMLPAVLDPGEPAGVMTAEAADALGLPDQPVVAAGTGDNMAAALYLGLEPGAVAVSIGTSGTVFAVSPDPTADPSGAVAGFADATGAFLPLVCTLNASKVTDTFAGLLGMDAATLDSLALSVPAGAGGLTLLPYLDGERTPDRPAATGVLAGLRTTTDAAQLARAAYEGVVCGLLDGLDALLSATGGAAPGRLVVVGGGARSAAYRQILADLSCTAVETPEAVGEPVAAGACVQAAALVETGSALDIVRRWDGRGSSLTEPTSGVDAASVRSRYADLRGS